MKRETFEEATREAFRLTLADMKRWPDDDPEWLFAERLREELDRVAWLDRGAA